jgi:hypothetical protein
MIAILVACLIAILFELAAHWFPYQIVLRRKLPRLAAYAIGVLGILGPASGLEAYWLSSPAPVWGNLVGLWSVAVCAGLAVLCGYGIDWLANQVALAHERGEVLEMQNGRSAEFDGDAE